MAKFSGGWWNNWQNMLNGKWPAARPEDGIERKAGGPLGGTVLPSQIFTPHTGFTEDAKGKRSGTGGGMAINMPTIPDAEKIKARPDLVSGGTPWQYSKAKPSAPIKSISSQMKANSAALRGKGG